MDVTLLFAWPRITQPPGGNSSDIFGLNEQNGNIETVASFLKSIMGIILSLLE